MKIIELLNKINNGEEVPEKIKFDDTVFELEENKAEYSFQHKNGELETLLYRVMTTHFIDVLLKAEVEVIEENKEIKELEISEKDRKFHSDYINNIADKLNETIRKIIKEREEK